MYDTPPPFSGSYIRLWSQATCKKKEENPTGYPEVRPKQVETPFLNNVLISPDMT